MPLLQSRHTTQSVTGTALSGEGEAPAALSPSLTTRIVTYLDVRPGRANRTTLAALVAAYVRRVPWESAFRIARKHGGADGPVAARRPAEFWTDAMERGGGGTCFESNYAFFALLRALGFDGYLTVNDMGDTVGCHTAIVVTLGDTRYLADVGLPLHCPLPLDPTRTTRSRGPFHTYSARPDGAGSYVIERTRHPKRYVFTLRDKPIADADYFAASSADYGEGGLFLDRVIVTRVVGDRVVRFNSGEQPYRLESFTVTGLREDTTLDAAELAAILGEHFAMDAGVIDQALAAVGA